MYQNGKSGSVVPVKQVLFFMALQPKIKWLVVYLHNAILLAFVPSLECYFSLGRLTFHLTDPGTYRGPVSV